MARLDPVKQRGGASVIHTQRQQDHAPLHSHDEVMLFFPVRGRVAFTIPALGDSPLVCDEREALCVREGVAHAHQALDPMVEYLVTYLDPARLVVEPAVELPAWRFVQTLFLREAAAQLCAEAGQADAQAEAMASACVQILVIAALRGQSPARGLSDPWRPLPADARLARAMLWARERYKEAPSVDALAAQAGMSRRSLERAFREQLGLSPRQHLEDLRMAEAQRRLLAGAESVTEIAFDVGYKDLSHFIRAYQAVFGCSPTEARAAR
jgi:AraC-like DNA-binding protein